MCLLLLQTVIRGMWLQAGCTSAPIYTGLSSILVSWLVVPKTLQGHTVDPFNVGIFVVV